MEFVATYFTGDHHIGHAAARSFYRRPFASVADMDREMVARWNSVAEPADDVWHLGDFAVRQSSERVAYLAEILRSRRIEITPSPVRRWGGRVGFSTDPARTTGFSVIRGYMTT